MPEHDKSGRPYTLYEKCVRRLYLTNLFHPVRLGLQNIDGLHQALGSPMDRSDIAVIHVAGTNGKGSTSMKIARTLELAGNNVGLFVSPHVASFRERMQVNGELISEKEVEDYLPLIYDICEKERIPATFFEVTTALAFHFFAKRNVDVVVLETGLGGRLDATNVVKKPDLCVITSIGLEHTRILGDTVELIAMEKAGIIKQGVPVLVGPHCPHETIRKCALDKDASGYYTIDDVLEESSVWMKENGKLGETEFVDYDLENSMIARSALKLFSNAQTNSKNFPIAEEIMKKGLAQRPSCRFEEIEVQRPTSNKPVKVILDVAHNPDAMVYLVKKLEATYPRLQEKMRVVIGFSADKDLKVCGATILGFVSDPSRLHLVEAAHPRAAKFEDMLSAEPLLKKTNFNEEDRSITVQIRSALKLAEENDEILIVCGSVFLMAEAREAMGIDEPRDSEYIAEVAGANLRHGQEFFADNDPEKND
jgi:dihydrofolate synthase/folylpolyglutamate synthase